MKTVFITGGASGFGRALADTLAADHRIVIFGPDNDELQAVAQETEYTTVAGDVTDWESVQAAVNQIEEDQGIDVLINNAGLWIEGELEENDPARIAHVVAVNSLGPMLVTRAALPHMKVRGKGHIVNVISKNGKQLASKRSVYNASKWAITGFTGCLQEELKDTSIRVTGVYPGRMNTKLFERAGQEHADAEGMDPAQVAYYVAQAVRADGVEMRDLTLIPKQ